MNIASKPLVITLILKPFEVGLTQFKQACLQQLPLAGKRDGQTARRRSPLIDSAERYGEFLVGTRINEAHQDPSAQVAMDLRQNIVRKIASLLEARHLKESHVRFI